MTKEERAEYQRKYRKEHRDELNAKHRYYYHHSEKHREYQKKYYEAHKNDPEFKARLYQANVKWVKEHREQRNAYYRERYRKKCMERILAERSVGEGNA